MSPKDEEYPRPDQGIVIVWGHLAREPFGGMTWQILHYLVGLRRLGFDVWYVEDSDALPADPRTLNRTLDPSASVAFMQQRLDAVGLGNRWAYRRPMTNDVLGMVDHVGLEELYRRSVAVLNICGSQELLPWHSAAENLVYLETDPFFIQVRLDQGESDLADDMDRYRHLFSYGINLGTPLCPIPAGRYHWQPTLPPVIVDWWSEPGAPSIPALTTVANLVHTAKDVFWRGRMWRWSKYEQFLPFRDIPARTTLPLEMAVCGIEDEDADDLRRRGWRIRWSRSVDDPDVYRDYIRASSGEFSVAKAQYVLPRTGWTSDRTVCYLAAGRPCVVEDTAASLRIPTGWGMVTFTDPDSAVAAIDRVATDYRAHAYAAQELAREYFAADKVLADLMHAALGAAVRPAPQPNGAARIPSGDSGAPMPWRKP